MLDPLQGRPLPGPLAALAELALDLRRIGSSTAAGIWQAIDPDTWERTENPYLILLNAHRDRLDAVARDPARLAELAALLERRREERARPTWFARHHGGSPLSGVAYFSMEFGLSEALPIYSGGLGVLAGDHLKSASDLGVPLVGIGLLYQQGYFRQGIGPDGAQLEAWPHNDPSSMPIRPVRALDGRWLRVRVPLPGRTLLARAWEVRVDGVRVFLLDSNDARNDPWDRGISARLYDPGAEMRLLQEILLGFGGWQLLEKLGIPVEVCHLNEGHAAFAVLARAESFADRMRTSFEVALRATRAGNVFTTHTPVEAAFDRFDPAQVVRLLHPFLARVGLAEDALLALGRRDPDAAHEPFHMPYLALRGSCIANGVSRLHGQVSRELFAPLYPGRPPCEVPIGHVTNGVHVASWDSRAASAFWSRATGRRHAWVRDLDTSVGALEGASDEQIWELRNGARRALVEYVRRRLVRQVQSAGADARAVDQAAWVLDPDVLTLGFARRFTPYKRPDLLLRDAERLTRILGNPERPVQLVVAGKAHPDDRAGKAMVQAMVNFARRDDVAGRIVFLADHDTVLSRHLAGGCDVWINTPQRPREACGTSGMKCLVNGGLHVSVLDGWWEEAYEPDLGWALDAENEHSPLRDELDAEQLYELLEHAIAPEFYARDAAALPRAWLERVRASMQRLTARYSADRMLREYVEGSYLPAAAAFRARSAEGAKRALLLERWHAKLVRDWPGLRFGALRVQEHGSHTRFEVELELGDLPPDAVRVELYAEPFGGAPLACVAMQRGDPLDAPVRGFHYAGRVEATRPAWHYTPRAVPHHADAFTPAEAAHVLWKK